MRVQPTKPVPNEGFLRPAASRRQREYRTLQCMLHIWCAECHGAGCDGLCDKCRELLAYAEQRLSNCVFGDRKPTCARCPVHCYGRARRAQVREAMGYAGPRMIWRHPWLALLHLWNGLRARKIPAITDRRVP